MNFLLPKTHTQNKLGKKVSLTLIHDNKIGKAIVHSTPSFWHITIVEWWAKGRKRGVILP